MKTNLQYRKQIRGMDGMRVAKYAGGRRYNGAEYTTNTNATGGHSP